MKKMLTVLTIMLCSLSLSASNLDGVYQLVVENSAGQELSAGTGFYVNRGTNTTPLILTSYHLLNSRLLEADSVRLKSNKDVDLYVLAHDELNDVLVLEPSKQLGVLSFDITTSCSGPYTSIGYHKGRLIAAEFDGMEYSNIDGVIKIPSYLAKGFSGAPIFNDKARICGMVPFK